MARYSMDRPSWLPPDPPVSMNGEASGGGTGHGTWFSNLRGRARSDKKRRQVSSPEEEFIQSISKADIVRMLEAVGGNTSGLVKQLDENTGDTVWHLLAQYGDTKQLQALVNWIKIHASSYTDLPMPTATSRPDRGLGVAAAAAHLTPLHTASTPLAHAHSLDSSDARPGHGHWPQGSMSGLTGTRPAVGGAPAPGYARTSLTQAHSFLMHPQAPSMRVVGGGYGGAYGGVVSSSPAPAHAPQPTFSGFGPYLPSSPSSAQRPATPPPSQQPPQPADADTLLVAYVNLPNRLMQTPLMFAAYHGRDDVIKTLLAQGADVWLRDVWSRTALHYAAMKGHAACCSALLVSKPRKDERSETGLRSTSSHQSLTSHPSLPQPLDQYTGNAPAAGALNLARPSKQHTVTMLAAVQESQPCAPSAGHTGGVPLLVRAWGSSASEAGQYSHQGSTVHGSTVTGSEQLSPQGTLQQGLLAGGKRSHDGSSYHQHDAWAAQAATGVIMPGSGPQVLEPRPQPVQSAEQAADPYLLPLQQQQALPFPPQQQGTQKGDSSPGTSICNAADASALLMGRGAGVFMSTSLGTLGRVSSGGVMGMRADSSMNVNTHPAVSAQQLITTARGSNSQMQQIAQVHGAPPPLPASHTLVDGHTLRPALSQPLPSHQGGGWSQTHGPSAPPRYVDVRTVCGFTPLHFAAASGSAGVARVLLLAGASLDAVNEGWDPSEFRVAVDPGSTPLHVAARCGRSHAALAMMRAYAETHGADVLLVPTGSGRLTPPPPAAMSTSPVTMSASTRDPRTQMDSQGRTPSQVAALRGHRELATKLLPGSSVETLWTLADLAALSSPSPTDLPPGMRAPGTPGSSNPAAHPSMGTTPDGSMGRASLPYSPGAAGSNLGSGGGVGMLARGVSSASGATGQLGTSAEGEAGAPSTPLPALPRPIPPLKILAAAVLHARLMGSIEEAEECMHMLGTHQQAGRVSTAANRLSTLTSKVGGVVPVGGSHHGGATLVRRSHLVGESYAAIVASSRASSWAGAPHVHLHTLGSLLDVGVDGVGPAGGPGWEVLGGGAQTRTGWADGDALSAALAAAMDGPSQQQQQQQQQQAERFGLLPTLIPSSSGQHLAGLGGAGGAASALHRVCSTQLCSMPEDTSTHSGPARRVGNPLVSELGAVVIGGGGGGGDLRGGVAPLSPRTAAVAAIAVIPPRRQSRGGSNRLAELSSQPSVSRLSRASHADALPGSGLSGSLLGPTFPTNLRPQSSGLNSAEATGPLPTRASGLHRTGTAAAGPPGPSTTHSAAGRPHTANLAADSAGSAAPALAPGTPGSQVVRARPSTALFQPPPDPPGWLEQLQLRLRAHFIAARVRTVHALYDLSLQLRMCFCRHTGHGVVVTGEMVAGMDLCAGCMENKPMLMMRPCRHQICTLCAKGRAQALELAQLATCPMCDSVIVEFQLA